jgi:hypothetical protein
MERESFENPEIAAVMNAGFVNVKVDREERPDVDHIYMQAVQSLTGHGGWPMTVFLTPDGTPFYGGTYFPPEDRHGLPGFPRLLAALADAWRSRRAEVVQSGREIAGSLEQTDRLRRSATLLGEEILFSAFAGISSQFDEEWGGLGGAPKFPQPMIWEFVLRAFKRTGNPYARRMVHTTLIRMARGGMYGGEPGVSFRARGAPFAAPAVTDGSARWMGAYALAHYDLVRWLGFTLRYGVFDDRDGARTGVEQVLQSVTVAPTLHLSRLARGVRPLGVTFARTRHPLDSVDVRLEYRLNHSSEPVFSDAAPGTPVVAAVRDGHQVTLQSVVNF